MDIKTLEEKIAKRADSNVRARLRAFRNEVDQALSRLFCKSYHKVDGEPLATVLCARAAWCVGEIAMDGRKIKVDFFPDSLVKDEQSKLRDEIMSTMDTLQKVLMVPDDETPDQKGRTQ